MTRKYLIYAGIAFGAYLLYRNVFAANAGANPGLGGVDFGVADPSTW